MAHKPIFKNKFFNKYPYLIILSIDVSPMANCVARLGARTFLLLYLLRAPRRWAHRGASASQGNVLSGQREHGSNTMGWRPSMYLPCDN